MRAHRLFVLSAISLAGMALSRAAFAQGAAATPLRVSVAGPPALIGPLVARYGVSPAAVDTADGRSVTIRYVDGPYTRLRPPAQARQAAAVARFVWRQPARPRAATAVRVRFERPMRTVGDTGVAYQFDFSAADLAR